MMLPSIFGENLFDDFMTTPWEREFLAEKILYMENIKKIL